MHMEIRGYTPAMTSIAQQADSAQLRMDCMKVRIKSISVEPRENLSKSYANFALVNAQAVETIVVLHATGIDMIDELVMFAVSKAIRHLHLGQLLALQDRSEDSWLA